MIIDGTQLLKLMQCKLDMFEHHRCTTKCNIKRRDHQIQVNTMTMAMELVKLAKTETTQTMHRSIYVGDVPDDYRQLQLGWGIGMSTPLLIGEQQLTWQTRQPNDLHVYENDDMIVEVYQDALWSNEWIESDPTKWHYLAKWIKSLKAKKIGTITAGVPK